MATQQYGRLRSPSAYVPGVEAWDSMMANNANAPRALHHHHHHHAVSPPPAAPSPYPSSYTSSSTSSYTPSSTSSYTPSCSLWWGDLEPWMDDEYAKQVCALMGWDPQAIRVPHPPPDTHANNPGYCFLTFPSPAHAAAVLSQITPPGGAQLTMPNSTRPFVLNWAAGAGGGQGAPTSPVSPPGAAYYASASQQPQQPQYAPPFSAQQSQSQSPQAQAQQPQAQSQSTTSFAPQYPKEYSIFVGDLAPETSNSDLVAVFRNPVLGLRNDREPKFIRPFQSCKSAKIMLDPVTGVSRGYGFVRFTDEADQQRALIEMHGLYCLSRPMRISPATAKFKPPPVVGDPNSSVPNSTGTGTGTGSSPSAYGEGGATATRVSAATTAATTAADSAAAATEPARRDARAAPPAHRAPDASAMTSNANPNANTTATAMPNPTPAEWTTQQQPSVEWTQAAPTSAEWKHHAHARAILGNLIGPNGEQLTSTDPYNTTVFVGGLSPLVGEETLRTFFVPFGEIHYVKVPVGKHCGFVQFVRKADAERAIEKMQGFPVGGSRIRLSWGRSQLSASASLLRGKREGHVDRPPFLPVDKAAQAAAQAAQAAAASAVQPQPQQPAPMVNGMTQEQAIMLLQKFGMQGYVDAAANASNTANGDGDPYAGVNGGGAIGGMNGSGNEKADPYAPGPNGAQPMFTEEKVRSALLAARDDGPFSYVNANGRAPYEVPPPTTSSAFSPFSPDPNQHQQHQHQHHNQHNQHQQGQGLYAAAEMLGKRRDSYTTAGRESYTTAARDSYTAAALPHPSKAYAPGFFPLPLTLQTQAAPISNPNGNMTSPTRYGGYEGGIDQHGHHHGSPPAFQINRHQQQQQHEPVVRQPISRPGSGQTREREPSEFEVMHDLNGTLASLDLDRERELDRERDRPWSLKSPIPESLSSESTSSGGSVQFRMTMGRTPSP
ncbi:hypothetical protein C8J57DRAFT_1667603 [Mycena rebaudengoi]|nr:hypothetical protein C8J57DRAFT_1667603 [Mycena rebaudengoi]